MARLTKKLMGELLDANDGMEKNTYYEGKNFRESRHYKVKDGKLLIRSKGKTSWADSKFDNTYEADEDQTRRFIKKFIDY